MITGGCSKTKLMITTPDEVAGEIIVVVDAVFDAAAAACQVAVFCGCCCC